MKVKNLENINSYIIIRSIAYATIDIEETKAQNPGMPNEQLVKILSEKPVYSRLGPEGEQVDDMTGTKLQEKLDEAGEHRLLLDNGDYIADYRGTEYWIKKSGKWAQEKIEKLGISFPAGAVVQSELTVEQQKEISTQKEDERIASLSPQEKAEEKKRKLHAFAREAILKKEEADLLNETFDKVAWLEPKKNELEALYA